MSGGKPRVPKQRGFVDLHIHGYGGIDASEADEAGLLEMKRKLAAAGTLAFLPTLYPMPTEKLIRQLKRIREAGLLGAHLEGPFVNPEKTGALPRRYLQKPDLALMRRLLRESEGAIRRVTLAPELPGAGKLIECLVDHGVTVSMGHSMATFEEAKRGFRYGARAVTHLFNAMRPFHHREPGLAGFALAEEEVCAEVIGDGVHVADPVLKILFAQKRKLALVSDCLCGGGTRGSFFTAGGERHEVCRGVAYLRGTDQLSGSCSSLQAVVSRLVRCGLLSPELAVRYARTIPAKEMGTAL